MNKIRVSSKYYFRRVETCNLCISSSFTHQRIRNKPFLHFCLSVYPSVTLTDVFLIALQIKELYFLEEIAALLT